MASEAAAAAAATTTAAAPPAAAQSKPTKLHGRAFYESIGSPKYILAPMVDQSEFAWRMLTRSFLPEPERSSILAYTPMFHARLFAESASYRDAHFQPTRAAAPFLDGHPAADRPLIVQFCANDPAALLAAARRVAPHCDAVDLNLGCPQAIARRGRYGAFLQEDAALVQRLVRALHAALPVPVTAKIRVLATREATLAYARALLAAGASILAVHARRRDQKGHRTGLADWAHLRYLREHLPRDTVLFANGNVLQHVDLQRCLDATGADAVMSAEGNLSDPTLFAPPPPPGREGREYWRGRDGRGGYRVDAVVRRYLDIMHRYVLEQEPPARRPLFVPGDDEAWLQESGSAGAQEQEQDGEPACKKRRNGRGEGAGKVTSATAGPNLVGMQPHLFHLLRHLVTRHHDVRDALAKARLGDGDIAVHEKILDMVERKVAEGLLEYERTGGKSVETDLARNGAYEKCVRHHTAEDDDDGAEDDPDSSVAAVRRCKRPWWVVQPIVRPLPKEALAKGAIQLSKKERQKQEADENAVETVPKA